MVGTRQPSESSAQSESVGERADDRSGAPASNDAPLVGYNTNFRHGSRLFHVQTEDSGVQHPHVITHVFTDGGRIIASRKTSYAHLLSHPDVPGVVRRLMKEQHKALLLEIRQGSYDQPERTKKSSPQPLQSPAPATASTSGSAFAAASPPVPPPSPRTPSPRIPTPLASPGRPSVHSPHATTKPVPTLHELILRYLDEELSS
jgi:hypothetical protein